MEETPEQSEAHEAYLLAVGRTLLQAKETMTAEEYNELIVAAHLDQFEVNMALGYCFLGGKVGCGNEDEEQFLAYQQQWFDAFHCMVTTYRTSRELAPIKQEMDNLLALAATIDSAITFPVSFEAMARAVCYDLLTRMLSALEQKGKGESYE